MAARARRGLEPAISAAGGEALQQGGGRFVVRVLRHQFAAEGLGQQRRRQALGRGAGRREPGFQAVGEREQGFYAADDFMLFYD